MKTTTLSIALSLVMMTSCQYDPWANGFQTHQVADREVAGTYVVDADSQTRQIKVGLGGGTLTINKTATIVLSPDHKAEFNHVPVDYRGVDACSVTGKGSWKVGKNDSFTVVRASITNEEPTSRCKGEFAYELDLYGRKPPYKLHITIGDPDSGDAVQFQKQ